MQWSWEWLEKYWLILARLRLSPSKSVRSIESHCIVRGLTFLIDGTQQSLQIHGTKDVVLHWRPRIILSGLQASAGCGRCCYLAVTATWVNCHKLGMLLVMSLAPCHVLGKHLAQKSAARQNLGGSKLEKTLKNNKITSCVLSCDLIGVPSGKMHYDYKRPTSMTHQSNLWKKKCISQKECCNTSSTILSYIKGNHFPNTRPRAWNWWYCTYLSALLCLPHKTKCVKVINRSQLNINPDNLLQNLKMCKI